MMGSLCYCELASIFKMTGSNYVNVLKIYGSVPGDDHTLLPFSSEGKNLNCLPVRRSNNIDPGLHRKLWGGFIHVRDSN